MDCLNGATVHIASTFSEVNLEQGHLSRMQSIRKSFRQSLKRLNVRRSMRGGQSTQRSFRPAFVRSGSMRPSMKNRSAVGGIGASPAASHEATPMPPRRDSIRSITFSAPCQLTRKSQYYVYDTIIRICISRSCSRAEHSGWNESRWHHGVQY